MSDCSLKELIDMGFPEENAKKALSLNSNNVQQAIDWLFAHANDPATPAPEASATKPDSSASTSTSTSTLTSASLKLNTSTAETAEKEKSEKAENGGQMVDTTSVNSLKCDDCGMLLKDEDFATLHAHKTGHVNFSQSNECIKPKTPEEVAEQKVRLAEKLKKIRAEKAAVAKAEAIASEKMRRKQGREINDFKAKFQADEMKRMAEERRRDKIADLAYKQKVRDGIAADREAKKRAQAEAAAKAAGQPTTTTSPAPNPAPVLVAPGEKKEYTQCRIQIRLTDGRTMVQTFESKETLAAVRIWIEMNRTDGGGGDFQIMQTFPRHVYSQADMTRTLKELSLVPASSLVLTKM